ncbi:hypothetical protein TWF281_004188 [Arthrobotrys megalospora]
MSLNTLPTELKIQIVSYLPFPARIAIFDVSATWRSVAALFRKTRIETLRRRGRKRVVNQEFLVHQLLFNKLYCTGNCVSCRGRGEGNSRSREASIVRQYPLPPHRRYKGVYLTALLHPFNATVTTYEVWTENCEPSKFLSGFESGAFFNKLTLSDTHPYLDEPVFPDPADAPNSSRRPLPIPTEVELLFYIRFYFLKPIASLNRGKDFTTGYTAWEVVPGMAPHQGSNRGIVVDVPSGTTVRQLTSQAWQMMRAECYAEPEPAIKRVSHVRFSMSDWSCGRGLTGRPVLQVDLEAFGNSLDGEDEDSVGVFSRDQDLSLPDATS